MQKILYFLLAIFIAPNVFAVTRSWVGTTNDWATASNWSPSGVPTADDVLFIYKRTFEPIISSATDAHAKRIFIESGAILTINSGATLTITNENPSQSDPMGLSIARSTVINYGTITVNKPSEGTTTGIDTWGATITNWGVINLNGSDAALILGSENVVTNHSTGVINASNSIFDRGGELSVVSNSGLMNITRGGIDSSQMNWTNSGTINITSGGFHLGGWKNAALNNLSCGRIILESTNSWSGIALGNQGPINNSGLIQVALGIENSRTIVNNGVIKCEVLNTTGTLTNNGIIIRDKTDPIVEVSPSNSFSIFGIYSDAAASTSAGTFTAPDQFSPSASLTPGDITLYARIVAPGDACEYIVPFVYVMSPLPVTLVRFSAKSTDGGQNILTWVTSGEKDFSHFEIQRSFNAHELERIGLVVATLHHNTNLKSYSFMDYQTAGMMYYRLKMVDNDGSYQFSKIISAGSTSENVVVGSFYPNPSNGLVFVDINAEALETWHIRVFDTGGKLIATETRILQKGMNKIPLTTLTQGMNVVQFENSKSVILKKLIKQ